MLGFLIYALIGWLVYGLCFIDLACSGATICDLDFNWEITKWCFAIFLWVIITLVWPLGLAFGILCYFDEKG